jgi:hypothetical protein
VVVLMLPLIALAYLLVAVVWALAWLLTFAIRGAWRARHVR